jgi:hypothetical protein
MRKVGWRDKTKKIIEELQRTLRLNGKMREIGAKAVMRTKPCPLLPICGDSSVGDGTSSLPLLITV